MNVRREPHQGQCRTNARRIIRPNDGSLDDIVSPLHHKLIGIGQTREVRRTLGGFIFGVAYVCASLAISGWLLQRTAFDPGHTAEMAPVILQDNRIKLEIANTVADAVAAQRGLDQATVRQTVYAVASTKPGAELLAQVIHDAHARLIGEQAGPVRITGQQLVQIVRNEAVGDMHSITLPVPRVAALDRIRVLLHWLVPFGALFAVGLFVIGFMLHPNRSALLYSLSYGMVLLGLLVGILGYVAPRFVLPAFSDNIWADVSARLANDSLPLVVAMVVVFGAGGVMLLVGSGLLRRRRRWNAPLTAYKYREERRWG